VAIHRYLSNSTGVYAWPYRRSTTHRGISEHTALLVSLPASRAFAALTACWRNAASPERTGKQRTMDGQYSIALAVLSDKHDWLTNIALSRLEKTRLP